MLERRLKQIPTQTELRKQITFSDKFNNNMQKILKKERTKGFYHKKYYRKRVACIIILSILIWGYTFSVEAIRTPVIQIIKRIMPTSMWFQYQSDHNIPKRREHVIAPPERLEGGYALMAINHYKRHDLVEYRNNESEMVLVKRNLGKVAAVADIDHNAGQKVLIRGITGTYFRNDEKCIVSWYEPSYTYEVHLTDVSLTKEQTLNIINSFFKK